MLPSSSRVVPPLDISVATWASTMASGTGAPSSVEARKDEIMSFPGSRRLRVQLVAKERA